MQLFDNPLKLVIMDVDGVLLDLVRCLRKVFEATATGLDLDMEPLKQYLDKLDTDPTILSPDIVVDAERIWPRMDLEAAIRFAWKFQEQRRKIPFPPFDHSVGTLQKLRALRVPMALCTMNDRPTLTHQLEAAGIKTEWFRAMSTWECGFCKPDPRVLDTIFSAVPVSRRHAVYIGDRFGDLETARGGHVRFMAVLSGGLSRQAFLDQGILDSHILEHFGEFPERIRL